MRRFARALALMAVSGLMATSVAGCHLLPVQRRPGTRIVLPSEPAAALVVIVDAASARARAQLQSLVKSTARPGEHLIVLSTAGGALLGTFTAPAGLATTGPALPAPPPHNATSFQKAAFRKSLRHVRQVLGRDRMLLRIRQQRDLRGWANRSAAAALAAARRHASGLAGRPGLALAVARAVTDILGLQQTGVALGLRKVVAIIGPASDDASPPRLRASLDGVTVAVADGPDNLDVAAWQSDLLGAGASRVFALTSATGSQLVEVVTRGLDGKDGIAVPLTDIRYGPAQYRLPAAALPPLRTLRGLLAVAYPRSSATINGYTDNIAVRGGNLALSWRRADVVLQWLVAHGIAAARLQAVGYGAADPLAPNRPGGQPLNRRVVIIITPSS